MVIAAAVRTELSAVSVSLPESPLKVSRGVIADASSVRLHEESEASIVVVAARPTLSVTIELVVMPRLEEVQVLRKQAGRHLRNLREQAGLTQRELAAAVGFEYYTFISQLEGGRGR